MSKPRFLKSVTWLNDLALKLWIVCHEKTGVETAAKFLKIISDG